MSNKAIKEFPKTWMSWIDAIEKILIIITLAIAIWKGQAYVTEKTQQVMASKEQSKKLTVALDLLTNSYLSQLKILDRDIRRLDESILKEPSTTAEVAKHKYYLLHERVQEKQKFLESFGNQIIELQKYSISNKENR